MALADDILDIEVDLLPVRPGEIAHRPLSGAKPVVYGRDPGRWAGRLVLGRQYKREHIREAEAFIAKFNGQANSQQIHTRRDVIPTVANVTVSSTGTIVADGVPVTPSAAISAKIGQYARIGRRLYLVTNVTKEAIPVLTLWPPVAPAAGTAISPGKQLYVRLTKVPAPPAERDGGVWGPVTLEFEEDPYA